MMYQFVLHSMKILKKNLLNQNVLCLTKIRLTHSGPGSGAGKGGSYGGAIREAGGGMGRYGAAQEEGYFYNKSKEELEKLRQKIKDKEIKQKQKKEDEE